LTKEFQVQLKVSYILPHQGRLPHVKVTHMITDALLWLDQLLLLYGYRFKAKFFGDFYAFLRFLVL